MKNHLFGSRGQQPKKGKRIYFVEFLRVYLILTVFLCHVGIAVDGQMMKDILEFLGTSRWQVAFAAEPFFIIGGFFLYSRLAKEETINVFTYSLLLIQGMLVYYFVFNRNFGMDAHTCSLIIFTAAVPLVLIEYHIIEKCLTPVIKRALTRECE